jgi:hypothetical protein
MHYKGYVITKRIPTNEEIAKILEKYRETDGPCIYGFEWDWYEIGGRYGGKLKINFNPEENEDNLYCFKDRNNKYFISQIINEIKETTSRFYEELDYLKYMGLRDNTLYVDGAYFNDIIDFDITQCYLVIDGNEKLYVREIWDEHNWVKQENFEDEIKKIDLKDKFITIIDFHD